MGDLNENSALSHERIVFFSDAVFAIVITLLILEVIQTFHPEPEERLLQSVLHHWRSFFAFTIGFITVLVCWINHHIAMEYIKNVDTNFIWITGLLLFSVTLTPFSTAVLAEYLEKETATALAIFGFNYILISIAADAICTYANRHNFVRENDREFFNSYKLLYRYGLFYNIIGFLLCFVSVIVPIIMYVTLFFLFANPKVFANRIHKYRLARKMVK